MKFFKFKGERKKKGGGQGPKHLIFVLLAIIAFCLSVIALLIYKPILAYKINNKMDAYLQTFPDHSISLDKSLITVDDGVIDVVCIGNSLTLHGKCDYWWGEWGMAASIKERDYAHILKSRLEETGKKVSLDLFNFSVWEINIHDRTQTLNIISNKLKKNADLIVIQLGENIPHTLPATLTLEQDYIDLINKVKQLCPKSKVVVVGNYWYRKDVEEKKANACKATGIDLISLNEAYSRKYNSGKVVVHGDDGQEHKIFHAGVAEHPGDEGMKYIGDKIFNAIKDKIK